MGAEDVGRDAGDDRGGHRGSGDLEVSPAAGYAGGTKSRKGAAGGEGGDDVGAGGEHVGFGDAVLGGAAAAPASHDVVGGDLRGLVVDASDGDDVGVVGGCVGDAVGRGGAVAGGDYDDDALQPGGLDRGVEGIGVVALGGG